MIHENPFFGVRVMAEIRVKKDKDGNVRAYKIVVTLGRDERNRKVYVSTTIPRPEGLTPKKEEKEIKRIADGWEHDRREEYEANNKVVEDRLKKKKIRMGDFIDELWIKKHVEDGNHTPDTVAFYKHMGEDVKKYFKENKQDKRLAEVSRADVLDYLLFLRNDARTKSGNPYSATTIQHHYSTLRNIMEFAVYIEYIKENPCVKIKKTDRPKREETEIDFLEEEDAVRFMLCLDSDKEKAYWEKHSGTHLQWKTLINILIVTGIRRGELVGLKWGDFDKKNMVLSVRRNVTIDTSDKEENDPAKKIHVGSLKGKKSRIVAVSKYIIDLLDDLKAERTERYGEEPGKEDYVFCREDNTSLPMYPTEPTRMVRKFIKRHGLPNVSPHDLRHTAASLAIQSGANIKEIQELLGHRDAATTLEFYAGISRKARRETIDGIESIIRPNNK